MVDGRDIVVAMFFGEPGYFSVGGDIFLYT